MARSGWSLYYESAEPRATVSALRHARRAYAGRVERRGDGAPVQVCSSRAVSPPATLTATVVTSEGPSIVDARTYLGSGGSGEPSTPARARSSRADGHRYRPRSASTVRSERVQVKIAEAATEFLACRRIAVTGVSRTPGSHGSNVVYDRLVERGYEVFPVNPNAAEIGDKPAYPSLTAIPGGVDAVVIGTAPARALDTMKEAVELASITSGCTARSTPAASLRTPPPTAANTASESSTAAAR